MSILWMTIYIYIYIYAQKKRENAIGNCRYFKSIIYCIHFICFWFCQLGYILDSVGQYLWEKQDQETINSSQSLEMACRTIRSSSTKTGCVQWCLRWHNLIVPIRKLLPLFLRDEVYDWQQFNRFSLVITREMGKSGFLIMQVVHEDIFKEDVKVPIFKIGHEIYNEIPRCKDFQEATTKHSLVFFVEKNINNDEILDQRKNFGFICSHKMYRC